MTVIPIVVGALGTVLKGIKKSLGKWEIRGGIETTALSKSARIFTRVLETCRDVLSHRVHGKIIC